MSLLDSLINMKQQQEAQANADLAAIPQAVNSFIQGRQQAKRDLIDELTLKSNLATKGLGVNFNTGEIYRDDSLRDPMSDFFNQAKVAKAKMDINNFLDYESGKPAPEGFVRVGGKIQKDPTYKRVPTAEERKSDLENEIAKTEIKEQSKVLPKLDQAFQSIQQLQDLYYEGANPTEDPTAARLGGVLKTADAARGGNPALKQYLTNREGFAGLIAKGGFGESGMLTNQDIERITKLLPNEYSTKKEADLSFKEINTILGSARKRFEATKEKYLGEGSQKKESMNKEVDTSGAQDLVSIKLPNGQTAKIPKGNLDKALKRGAVRA